MRPATPPSTPHAFSPGFPRRTLLAASICLAVIILWPMPSAAQQIPPDGAAPDPAAAILLDTVQVVGRRESGAYYAGDATGTKTDLVLRELPQSVRVLSRQAIDDLGATRLDDTLDYVGGVSRQNNFGGLWDNVAIRGLPGNENTGSSMLLNGLSANRGFNAPRDTADVERIEFLKGPVSTLYGSSEPGGTVNVVSKAPLWRAGHSFEGYAGSHDFRRLSVDSSGPLGDNVAYRLNAAIEDRNSFRDEVDSQRKLLAPALTWRLGDRTEINYTGQWLRHESVLDRGVVAINNELGAVPRERFLGEPADGRVRVENTTHQLVLDHALGERWALRSGLSRRDGSLRGFSTEATAVRPDGRTLTRQRRFRDYVSDDTALQVELRGDLDLAGTRHDLLLGVESYEFHLDQLMLRVNPTTAAPYAIDLFAPVYGQPQPTPLPNTDTRERQRNTAVYLQDAIRLGDRWRVVLGVRNDSFRQTLDNLRTGASTSQGPTQTTPRVGVSWMPSAAWTLYANAGRSFRPNAGSGIGGQAFDPESGRALEGGAKWQAADGRTGGTLSLFDIEKRNVVTGDPANPGFAIAAGGVRSRGIELDFSGQVTDHLRVNASLVQLDVEVTRDNVLAVGRPLINVPRRNGSLLAVYENTLPGGSLYGLGGGATYVGERLGATPTQAQANAGVADFILPAYATAKLVAYWRVNPTLRLSLDVDNVFDRTYYSSSVFQTWVTPGNARMLTLGAQVRF